ncbi:MAG: energy-coupling factor transporter transmembrane component T [Corynebacterium sp.]|nr:energy-coupling factor transporter transmembrane component T [Corynebacterium sp.]
MPNPITSISCGLSTWILVLGCNNAWVSLAVSIIAIIVGTMRTRSLSFLATIIALSLPTALSMLLIYVPFTATYTEGLLQAGQLALRFIALMAALLAAFTFVHIPDLVKALQLLRIHHSISFLLGSALQFLPQAQQTTHRMREAHLLAGRKPTPFNLIIPVIVQVLFAGGQRVTAVKTLGLDLPGRRTVLRSPSDSPAQKLFRILLPLIILAVVLL